MIGAGAKGTVYEARDIVQNRLVAIKILQHERDRDKDRLKRELRALQLLRIEGVASLIDEGALGPEHHFIVMELIEGTPFPGDGNAGSWESVSPVALRLLAILQRIHSAGVVHRDLKPSNILVTASGEPTVLDFGLARGGPLGETFTLSKELLGTPRYLAPEQIRGERIDNRTDLYSTGAMLFEAISGVPPHTAPSLPALFHTRLTRDPPRLQEVSPETPLHIAQLVDRLLSREAHARPQSIDEVLSSLSSAPKRLPWLGGGDVLDGLLASCRSGRSRDLQGDVGTGRTRHLEALEAALRKDGIKTGWTIKGGRPFESLLPLMGGLDLTQVEATKIDAVIDDRLRRFLAAPSVLLADDVEHLDRWSAAALERNRSQGTIIRAFTQPKADALVLAPLSEADLRDLFEGPELFLHLPTDGASVLFERTWGIPRQIDAEVRAWVGADLAQWSSAGRLIITRESLQKLGARPPLTLTVNSALALSHLGQTSQDLMAWIALAWPHSSPETLTELTKRPAWELHIELAELESRRLVKQLENGHLKPLVPHEILAQWSAELSLRARQAIVDLLEPGADGRLDHLCVVGDACDIAQEALLVANRLWLSGRDALASEKLFLALSGHKNRPYAPSDLEALAGLLTIISLHQEHTASPQSTLEFLGACSPQTPHILKLRELLQAALEMPEASSGGVEARASSIEPFEDQALEGARQMLLAKAAFRRGLDEAERFLEKIEPWVETTTDNNKGMVLGWLGLLQYRREDYARAAELHRQASELRSGNRPHLASLLNVAYATLETLDFEAAITVAEQVLTIACERRLTSFEASATAIALCARYRQGEDLCVDQELLDALESAQLHSTNALVHLVAAACDWREGRRQQALERARVSMSLHQRSGNRAMSTLAAALIRKLGEDDTPLQELKAMCLSCPYPLIGIQTIALAFSSDELGIDSRESPDWLPEAVNKLAEWPNDKHQHRLEILSIGELLEHFKPQGTRHE